MTKPEPQPTPMDEVLRRMLDTPPKPKEKTPPAPKQ